MEEVKKGPRVKQNYYRLRTRWTTDGQTNPSLNHLTLSAKLGFEILCSSATLEEVADV